MACVYIWVVCISKQLRWNVAQSLQYLKRQKYSEFSFFSNENPFFQGQGYHKQCLQEQTTAVASQIVQRRSMIELHWEIKTSLFSTLEFGNGTNTRSYVTSGCSYSSRKVVSYLQMIYVCFVLVISIIGVYRGKFFRAVLSKSWFYFATAKSCFICFCCV